MRQVCIYDCTGSCESPERAEIRDMFCGAFPLQASIMKRLLLTTAAMLALTGLQVQVLLH